MYLNLRPPESKAEGFTKNYYNGLDYLRTLKLPLVITGDYNFNLLSDNIFAVKINLSNILELIINELSLNRVKQIIINCGSVNIEKN